MPERTGYLDIYDANIDCALDSSSLEFADENDEEEIVEDEVFLAEGGEVFATTGSGMGVAVLGEATICNVSVVTDIFSTGEAGSNFKPLYVEICPEAPSVGTRNKAKARRETDVINNIPNLML